CARYRVSAIRYEDRLDVW
nr:immunoglobulin heavy chain junction region [Macaca mulatta]MOY19736.1 immunoglobulin heavy chain junction region [Macaca mulatta]MOY20613.1 immunoglobulin heavy chain junction region [Macaca mulatta]